MLLELLLEFHAWAAARPTHVSEEAAERLEKEVKALQEMEREQGTSPPSPFPRARSPSPAPSACEAFAGRRSPPSARAAPWSSPGRALTVLCCRKDAAEARRVYRPDQACSRCAHWTCNLTVKTVVRRCLASWSFLARIIWLLVDLYFLPSLCSGASRNHSHNLTKIRSGASRRPTPH